MKKIFHKQAAERILKEYDIEKLFDSEDIHFIIIQYDKGEYLEEAFSDADYFQFVISGDITVFCIRPDGSRFTLDDTTAPYIIGDLEFVNTGMNNNVFVQANTDVITLAVSLRRYRDVLMNDNRFLRLILKYTTNKLIAFSEDYEKATPLSEKTINYMRYKCRNGTLKGVEKCADILNCSPRQLQRVLNNLSNEGKVTKVGKGTYKLL